MINSLRYAVTFPTNGVSLSGELSFQPGSTAISGPNGTGKSFIAEMIRYGLFGAKARRGPTSDYKSLDMSLDFQVSDQKYAVIRGKKEFLYDIEGGEPIAVGADAVNKKIVEILGFDLEVFDVVCAANQKESERLTKLTPARRKELIDDVVGLTQQEAVEKACREEAKVARVEAETLTRMLVAPVEPVKPEGYRPSEQIAEELSKARELERTRAQLQKIIDAVPPEPVKPSRDPVDIGPIEANEANRMRNDATRTALERNIASIPDPSWTREQLDEAVALDAYDAQIAALGPKPWIDEPSLLLKEMLDTWDEIDSLTRLERIQLHCPRCDHAFYPDQTIPEKPPFSRSEITTELAARTRWAEIPAQPKGVRIHLTERAQAERALERAEEKRLALEEIDRIRKLPDMSKELAFARECNQEWAIYSSKLDHFTACAAEAGDAQFELDQLEQPSNSVAELDAAFVSAKVYETQLDNYSEQKQRFDELSQEIGEKQERSEAFLAGAKGLVEARRTLKAFLAPSLSRVSSKIIREMTENSQRPLFDIVIDEDMNITADGQDVSTFNGAHATMINLALRLALGQVLVARVFPVFIGDEIDSDADEANAQSIADALMACKEQLKQIVLISHKRLEGVDHEVVL